MLTSLNLEPSSAENSYLGGSDAEGPESEIRPHEPLHIDVGEGDEGARWEEDEITHKLKLNHERT